MREERDLDKMAPAAPAVDRNWPELHPQRRAIVVVDVVESVRLMQANEADVIDRWRRFVDEIRCEVLPSRGGRLVKSLGDGMLLEFGTVRDAGAAALAMQHRVSRYNEGHSEATVMYLRIGVHLADVLVDDLDVYGSGVNLAARLAALGGCGETIVSAPVRAQLVADLDVAIEDLGECYVKHIEQPVHVFRVGPPEVSRPPTVPLLDQGVPGIAVVPPYPRPGQESEQVWGNVLAEELIAALSKSTHLRVISRMSTEPFRERGTNVGEIAHRLGVQYVLSGSFAIDGAGLAFFGELCEAKSGEMILSLRERIPTRGLLAGDIDATAELASNVAHAVLRLGPRSEASGTAGAAECSKGAFVGTFQCAGDDHRRADSRFPVQGSAGGGAKPPKRARG